MRVRLLTYHFFKYFVFCILAISSIALAGGNTGGKKSCEASLGGKINPGDFFGEDVGEKMSKQLIAKFRTRQPFNEAEVKTFLESGWPALQKLSAASGTTPDKLISVYHELLKVGVELDDNDQAKLKLFKRSHVAIENILVWLQQKDIKRIKPNEINFVGTIMMDLHTLAMTAMSFQMELFNKSDLNPLLKLNEAQIQKILATIEESGEEAILIHTLKKEEQRAAKAAAIAAKSETIAVASGATKAEMTAAAKVNFSNETAGTNPATTEANHQVEKEKPAIASKEPVPLIELIKSNGQFVADQVYEFENYQGQTFTITFEPEIAKVATNSDQARSIFRLLSSLYVGSSSSSGLKLLSGSVKGLIEVKASLHGHKRLLGCIEGRHIVIKKFFNMPETVAGYARMISHRFCE